MRIYLTDNGRLGEVRRGVDAFRQGHARAINRAVQEATTTSRATFKSKLSDRPHIPRREGRPTTGGNFARLIRWEREEGRAGAMRDAGSTGSTFVSFQLQELEGRAPYWLIQEIGTGESATILDRGENRSVKAQSGRAISPALTWADAQGNYDVARHGVNNQQLMSLQDVKNLPMRRDMEQIRIRKEIDGKHYIRKGGMQANRQYRDSLMALARRAFQ